MSKGKEKVLEVEDDELDFLPSLLTDPAFDSGLGIAFLVKYFLRSQERRIPLAGLLGDMLPCFWRVLGTG